MTGNLQLTPTQVREILTDFGHWHDFERLSEDKKTLLKQAKNCRDLAHFLRTDPRVEGHFDMLYFLNDPERSAKTLVSDKSLLHKCGITACAGGWAIYMGIVSNIYDLNYAFGTTDSDGIFGTTHRTAHEEALVLERHALELEAQV